jgi:hypothetical protein
MRLSNSLKFKLWLPPLLLITAFLGGCFLNEKPWLDLKNASTPLSSGRYKSEADQDHIITVEQISNHYAVTMSNGEQSKLPPKRYDPAYLVKVPDTQNLYGFFAEVPITFAAQAGFPNGLWMSVVTWVSPEGLFCVDENYVGVHAPNGALTSRPSGQFSSSIASPEQLVGWIAKNQGEVEEAIRKNAKGCFHTI